MNNNQITIDRLTYYKEKAKWIMEYFFIIGGAGRGEELEITEEQAKSIIEACQLKMHEDDYRIQYEKGCFSFQVENTDPDNTPAFRLGTTPQHKKEYTTVEIDVDLLLSPHVDIDPLSGHVSIGKVKKTGIVLKGGKVVDGKQRYHALMNMVNEGKYTFVNSAVKALHQIREEGEQVCVFGETGMKEGVGYSHSQYMVKNDGGRAEAGFSGTTGDCVTRAIAIVTQKPYKEVYDALNELSKKERTGIRKKKKSNSRTGVYKTSYDKYLKSIGMVWTPLMKVGQKERVHLRGDELPSGRIIVRCTRHLSAVINGVVHDTHDPCRGGTRTAYGYYSFPEEILDNLKEGDLVTVKGYTNSGWSTGDSVVTVKNYQLGITCHLGWQPIEFYKYNSGFEITKKI